MLSMIKTFTFQDGGLFLDIKAYCKTEMPCSEHSWLIVTTKNEKIMSGELPAILHIVNILLYACVHIYISTILWLFSLSGWHNTLCRIFQYTSLLMNITYSM